MQVSIIMLKRLLTIATLAFSGFVGACECGYSPLDTHSAQEARNVFIFRLVSAQIARHQPDLPWNRITGNVDIVETLRGDAKSYKTLHFSTTECCGSRLDVGHYFVAFVSDTGTDFQANSGTVLDLGGQYFPKDPTIRERIESVLTGKMAFENAFSGTTRYRTEQISPPPPPCPDNAERREDSVPPPPPPVADVPATK